MLCHRIADASKLVIPEATAERIKKCVMEVKRPDYFTITEVLDEKYIQEIRSAIQKYEKTFNRRP